MSKLNEKDFCNEIVFSSFFRKQFKSLSNFLYYKCGNEDLANDLAQDAFIKFWKNCFKVILGKESSYLYTIANNLFLNSYSKSKIELKFKSEPQKNSTNVSPEFLLEEKEFNYKLQKAISNLSEAQRTAFLMNRIDGKKYREIAEILGISVKAVEKRIHNSLINLRKEIKEI